MQTHAVPLCLGLLGIALTAAEPTAPLPWRWFYASRGLGDDHQVEELTALIRTAAEHGLNGMALSVGLDNLDRPNAGPYLERLHRVREAAAAAKIDIIPVIFSIGYGGGILAHDRNLAEGLPVTDALFVAHAGEGVLTPDPPVSVVNGDFETWAGDRAKAYGFHDQPGTVSFRDAEVVHGGTASMRFENFGANPHGHGRVMQELGVAPNRCYRVRCWVRTQDLAPAGCFRLQVYGKTEKGRALAPFEPRVPATSDWVPVVFVFNSAGYSAVRLYAGVWGAKSGRFWVDDLSVEELGPLNVLRRPGTPVTVRGEANGVTYEEGRDFERLEDPKLDFRRLDREAPHLRLTANTRISEGERLRLSWYHGMAINDGQVSVCMSEPKVYEILRTQARLLHEHLAPRFYLLSMDEIRAGGTCAACRARGLTMAEILGDCVTREVQALREVDPAAEVAIWSDMLDPNHNAHGDYYLVEGDYTGSWNYIPKDLIIACWYHEKRVASLAHFAGLGLRTLGAAYYDADTLDNPRDWLAALAVTPKACGIMYTTWRNKYALLADFGALVSGTPRP